MKLLGIKRILPLILTVLLLPALLAVPARADEVTESGWINLMDYGGVNGGSGQSVSVPSGGSFWYNTPDWYVAYHVDIIFHSTESVADVYLFMDSIDYVLTPVVYDLGDGIYRVTLDFRWGVNKIGVVPSFVNNATSVITVLKFSVSTGTVVSQQLGCVGHARAGIAQTSFNTVSPGALTAVPPDMNCEITLVPAFWKEFDFLTVYLQHDAYQINSISADLGLLPVPYEVDYLGETTTSGKFRYSITLDLRGLDRDSAVDLNIRIQCRLDNESSVFYIQNCVGYVVLESPSDLAYWFTSLKLDVTSGFASIGAWFESTHNILGSWFSEQFSILRDGFGSVGYWGQAIVDAINGTGNSSQLKDDINQSVGALQQAGAALDAVDRPDIGQIDINVVGQIDPAGLTGLASIVGVFTGNSMIYSIMLMFLTLALISFVLFGKG